MLSLIEGLIYVVEVRRPVDIQYCPISAGTLNELFNATVEMCDAQPATIAAWNKLMYFFKVESRRLKWLRKGHMTVGAGPIGHSQRPSSPPLSSESEYSKKAISDTDVPSGNDPATNAVAGGAPRIHSEDFSWVNWDGIEYHFSPNQADVVRRLWKALQTGVPSVHGKSLVSAGTVRNVFKIRGNEFHPAWKTMILPVPGVRNIFRLAPQTEGQSPPKE